MVHWRRDVEDVGRAFLRVKFPRVLVAHREETRLLVRIVPSAFAAGKTNGKDGYAESCRETNRETCDLSRTKPLIRP